MFLGAYWSARPESRAAAAERVLKFLSRLARSHESFSVWYPKGRGRALRDPLKIEAESIEKALKVNCRDVDGAPISEIGFEFSAWNGRETSLAIAIGAYSAYVGNSVVLTWSGADSSLDPSTWKSLLLLTVDCFDPDHSAVTSAQILREEKVRQPWEAGMLLYSRPAGLHGPWA
jgi:hypothetical protein